MDAALYDQFRPRNQLLITQLPGNDLKAAAFNFHRFYFFQFYFHVITLSYSDPLNSF